MSQSLPSQEDDAPSSPWLRLLIMITLVTVVVAAGYLADYYLRGNRDAVTWFPPAAGCDLHRGACTASLGHGGRLEFAIDGRLRPLEPLPLEVRLEGVEATAVTVEFLGRRMPMGLHRFPLEAVAPGHYRGLGQLGVCTEQVMPWRAQVVIETAEGRRGSWFDFDVTRRPG